MFRSRVAGSGSSLRCDILPTVKVVRKYELNATQVSLVDHFSSGRLAPSESQRQEYTRRRGLGASSKHAFALHLSLSSAFSPS